MKYLRLECSISSGNPDNDQVKVNNSKIKYVDVEDLPYVSPKKKTQGQRTDKSRLSNLGFKTSDNDAN